MMPREKDIDHYEISTSAFWQANRARLLTFFSSILFSPRREKHINSWCRQLIKTGYAVCSK